MGGGVGSGAKKPRPDPEEDIPVSACLQHRHARGGQHIADDATVNGSGIPSLPFIIGHLVAIDQAEPRVLRCQGFYLVVA